MFGFFKNKKKTDQDATNASDAAAPLVEGVDFYIEQGFYVFTAQYHLKRGHCCGSGCRHCPYKK